MLNVCYLILGSNKGDKRKNIENANKYILSNIGEIEKYSSIYESKAWGYNDPEPYYNQVIKLLTHLDPQTLLQKCLEIEDKLGRIRTGNHYENRTIDIDILFHDKKIIETDNLVIPHPRLHLRNFVLIPLLEISPDLVHPVLNKSISELALGCNDTGKIKKLVI